MSAAHDAHADASAAHHAHDHFDNEPATELGADEPRTPNWVPYLGLALFFSAGIACLMCGGEDKPAGTDTVKTEAAATPPPMPQPQQMPQPQARPAGMPGQPGQPGAMPNALNQLTPERARELQKQMEAIQGLHNPNGAQPGQPPGGAPQRAIPVQPGAVPQPAPQPPQLK